MSDVTVVEVTSIVTEVGRTVVEATPLATVPVGPRGDTGPQGVQGPQGDPGDTGPAGATGANGATGAAGPVGAQGAVGATGATGATGPQGGAGATGATGVEGPQGDPGPQGPAGADGDPGGPNRTLIAGWGYQPEDLLVDDVQQMFRAIATGFGGSGVAGQRMGVVMPRAGSITAISVRQINPTGSGSTLTYRPLINDVPSTAVEAVVSGDTSTGGLDTVGAGVVQFDVGDTVSIEIELTGAFTSSTRAEACLEVQFV